MGKVEFQVSRALLEKTLHLPLGASIVAIWGDYDHRVVNLIVSDPAVPDSAEPHRATPSVTDPQWNWNLDD